MNIKNAKDLKQSLRNGPYAWPGGYPMYFITDDGAALSFDCVTENYKLVLDAVKHQYANGWCVVAIEINFEDCELVCSHSGKPIECAYGE